MHGRVHTSQLKDRILAYFPNMKTHKQVIIPWESQASATILHCLQYAVQIPGVIILDGDAIVNMLRPATAKTFNDCATQVFLPYIESLGNEGKQVG